MKARVEINPMLISLLVYEFCVRWLVNAFDSTYGSWMMEDYGITESAYSYAVMMILMMMMMMMMMFISTIN